MLTSIDICIIHIIFCDSSQNLGFDFENLIASIKHTKYCGYARNLCPIKGQNLQIETECS